MNIQAPASAGVFVFQLEGKIQERYGIAKDQAKKDVDAWFNSLKW